MLMGRSTTFYVGMQDLCLLRIIGQGFLLGLPKQLHFFNVPVLRQLVL